MDLDELVDDNVSGNTNGNERLPNGGGVLALGIISIATCWLYGIPGLVCGIIAIVLGKKGKASYDAEPSRYDKSSYANLNAGYICGIIGVCLSAFFLISIIWGIATAVGSNEFSESFSESFNESFNESLREAMEKKNQ